MIASIFVLSVLLASLSFQHGVEAYFITDIKLMTCEANQWCPYYIGYQVIPVNLNEGTMLPSVYLNVREDPSDDPITALRIVKSPKRQPIPNWVEIDVDLNIGGDNSTSLWLYFTKDKSVSPNPITSILVKTGPHPTVGAEYTRISTDLNDGVGGENLHMYYSQDGPKDPITAISAQACFTDDCYREGWERVEKDVNEGVIIGMRVYLFYQRIRGAPPVTDTVIILNNQSPPEGYEKVDTDLNSVTIRGDSIYLWYKVDKSPTEEVRAQALQELAIEYGENPVTPPGWTKISVDLNSKQDGQGSFGQPTFLFYRRGYQEIPATKPLSFDANGQLKILQVSDLHFTHLRGTCVDVPWEMDCKGDDTTLLFIEALLDKEKPDFVVFTGDNVVGRSGVSDARAGTFKFTEPVIRRKIPWAAIFGNHDGDADLSREELFEVMRRLPFSLTERGPRDLPGVGNYVVPVYSNESAAEHAFTIYFMDSHTGGLLSEQLDWLQSVSQGFARGNDAESKPNAMAFFHIPIWEYNLAENGPALRLGDQREHVSSPPKDAIQALQVFKTVGDIKATSCGHDHVNDYCQERDGIQLCYGGGFGMGAYGASHLGWPRRARLWLISEWGTSIQTWRRLHDDKLTMTGYQTLFYSVR